MANRVLTEDEKVEYCKDCVYARFETDGEWSPSKGWYHEYSFEECRSKIPCEPYWDEEQEHIECDGYKEELHDD